MKEPKWYTHTMCGTSSIPCLGQTNFSKDLVRMYMIPGKGRQASTQIMMFTVKLCSQTFGALWHCEQETGLVLKSKLMIALGTLHGCSIHESNVDEEFLCTHILVTYQQIFANAIFNIFTDPISALFFFPHFQLK